MSSSLRRRAESEEPVSRQLLQTEFVHQPANREEEDTPHTMVWSRDAEAERPQLSVILPGLYLGAERDVTQDRLASLGISYVLSVSRCSPQPSFLPHSRFLRIPIDDSLWDNLLPWIPQALSFIDSAMSSGASVLLHCAAGISRSPALAVAYIMYSLELDLDHAYRFVKERRPSISPNFNFLGQLQHFQGILNQKTSTKERGTGLLRSQNRNHCVHAAMEDSIIQTRKSLLDDSGNKRGPWTFDLVACQNQQCNQKPCDAPASSLSESRESLPMCRQLQFPSGCTSLLEKRKSLTLSLMPLGFCPPSLASSHPQSVAKASPVHSVPHPEQSPRLGGCSRAEEKERGLLSPSSITLNKLFDWGERVLLGLVHPVKVGQPALPYRC